MALPILLAQNPPEWSRPFPAHRIAGHVYYVGTEDLACYLITDPAGHILINSGLADSAPMVKASVEKLGFRLEDVKIILTNQAHFDHAAGMAELVRMTKGAKVFATPPDAKILEDGGKSDPAGFTNFQPVKVSRLLQDREHVRLGKSDLLVLHSYGHSPGSVSYLTEVEDNGKKKSLFLVNLPSIVMPLANPKYPNIVADLERTFAMLQEQKPQLWVATHGGQVGLKSKFEKRNYEDPAGYAEAVASYLQRFRRQVKMELGK